MAKVAVPIISVQHNESDTYPLEVVEVFDDAGATQEDDYTYTFRVSLPAGEDRERVRASLRERCPLDFERLVTFLDQHEWDVSFLVDVY